MSALLKRLTRGLCLVPAALMACQTTASADPVPALLESADESSVRVLKSTIAKAMKTNSVQFGVADLANSPKISAIPMRLAGPPGAPLNHASNFAIPTTFTLMMDGPYCYLLKDGSNERIPLNGVACRPMIVQN